LTNDGVDHNTLDTLFNYAADFTTSHIGETDATYRFATLGGVHVALPTLGSAVPGSTFNSGTAVGAASPDQWQGSNAANATYNDLLAVWDAHNGTGTGTSINGIPSAWASGQYWSASSSFAGSHYDLYLNGGGSIGDPDNVTRFVALQVLP